MTLCETVAGQVGFSVYEFDVYLLAHNWQVVSGFQHGVGRMSADDFPTTYQQCTIEY